MPKLSSHDQVRIAAEAVVSPRTVLRIYSGANAEVTTRVRVHAAALRLGLPLPPATAIAGNNEANYNQERP